jgi:acyl carrier protein
VKIEIPEIKEIIEFSLDRELDEFSMTTDFYEEYMMDSLGAVALVVEVQKRYDVRIADDRVPHVRTGKQLEEIIRELVRLREEQKVEA